MKKIFIYSLLLLFGLFTSQFTSLIGEPYSDYFSITIKFLTMTCLSYIMIRVGLDFELEKKNLRKYVSDYFIAATAASFPWIFCTIYFIYFLPPDKGPAYDWREAILAARFAAPTSAGVLFAMLAAAGLSTTWMFKKTRLLAIFDDLDTIILMIPLKIILVGLRWELSIIVINITFWLWLGWVYLRRLSLRFTWNYVLGYAMIIAGCSEAVYLITHIAKDIIPIHVEVLLPAFVIGCILTHPKIPERHSDLLAALLAGRKEKIAADIISGLFMVLVGLSMPSFIQWENVQSISENAPLLMGSFFADISSFFSIPPFHGMPWGDVIHHVFWVILLANLGKMFPLLCYRKEANWKERLALCLGMCIRGEVSAGIIVVSLSLGVTGPMILISVLSLTFNLTITFLLIGCIKMLLFQDSKKINY